MPDPEHALRDLMGLVALPGLWIGRDGDTILRMMVEALERVVPVDVAILRVPLLADGPAFDALRVDGRWTTAAEAPEWQAFAEACEAMPPYMDEHAGHATPVGALRIVRLHIGSGERRGSVWFGCREPDFPTTRQRAFMHTAASLASSSLHSARLRHEREEAARAKDEFLAMLGHELRNPLAPIVTALNIMRLRATGPPSREQAILERQVGHLTRLVDDLLDITRITRGKIELDLQQVDVRAALAQAIESVSPLLEQRQHRLTIDPVEVEGPLLADPARLQQILVNLLANAAKYTPAHGEIQVSARSTGQAVQIAVRDNGAGIDPELLPRIFRLFEQGRSSIERAQGGLGIGLALVQTLVDLHGGTITAESEGPGRGSLFTLTMPRVLLEQPALAAPAAARQHSSRQSERVLLVDDNADALEMMRLLLEELGFELVTALDPVEALEVAARFEPTVAVLDIGLPVMDGYELARELRERFAPHRLRLIALTGYGQSADRARALAAGFEAHLVKPVDADELVAAVKAARPLQ